jgi:exodeoxyribonuclease V beta subunit
MEGYQKLKDSGPDVIVPQKYNGGKDNSSTICPHLDDVVHALEDTLRIFDSLKHIVAVESIFRLGKEVQITKQSQGWISYDDMLKRVHATLTGPHAGRLLDPLRKQYRYAFVDEFQDTDPIQWQIFSRIFIESETNRLFLIGDPKQAIYLFRGADVFTYLSARHQLQRLAEKGRANCYFLDVNWRSTPSLVAGFNRLFSTTSWFGPSQTVKWHEITYLPAISPEANNLPEKIVRDASGRTALNLIDLRGPQKPGQAAADLARFIAREIQFLIADERIMIAPKKNPPRPLDPGDICILVRGRKDAPLLETELTDHQIPYSYYRRPGLFASDEAYYLSVVFRAVLSPSDDIFIKKALLTPFFHFRTDDLYAYDDLPASHPVRHLFLNWHQLAQHRYWGELFQSMRVDTGLIFREAKTPQWDRAETNYQQIFAYLSDIAYRKNLNFERLCTHLYGFRQQTIPAESDTDIHEIETEQHKVQIMTMHQAKGLQFPVVFIAGGLTQKIQSQYHYFHRIDSDHPDRIGKVIDLTRRVDPDRHQQESMDEDKRLLYVALTRAQFKLYAPFFPAVTRQRYFGPVCRFMAQAIDEAFSDTTESEDVAWLGLDIHQQTSMRPAPLKDIPPDWNLPPDLLPKDTYVGHRTTTVDSFSSIHGKKQSPDTAADPPGTIFSNDPTVSREDDESGAGPAAGIDRPIRPADEIPGGPDVGSMFHDILEHIDFSIVSGHSRNLLEIDPVGRLIRRYMTRYSVDHRFEPHVARVIADTLTMSIPQVGNTFTLGSLTPEDRRQEIAFYYTVPSSSDRLIRGVVDLVFRYQGVYYIADWKSNHLADGYAVSALAANMDAADYRLQYRLYTVAVLRWLEQVLGDRFSPRRHFGGVFYFYLRGMGIGPDHGIYYVSPDDIGSLASLEKALIDHE